jgi:phospholipid/cholesterol/gamma-HCH transport system permease protein
MASVDYEAAEKGSLRLIVKGSLDIDSAGQLWPVVFRKLAETNPKTLTVDASAVEYCDGAGIGLLLELRRRQEQNKGQIHIEGLKPEFSRLMTMFAPEQLAGPEPQAASFRQVAEQIGMAVVRTWKDLQSQISFIGEVFVKLLETALHPGRLRWKDTFLLAEKSGANAVFWGCAGKRCTKRPKNLQILRGI